MKPSFAPEKVRDDRVRVRGEMSAGHHGQVCSLGAPHLAAEAIAAKGLTCLLPVTLLLDRLHTLSNVHKSSSMQ